MTSFIVKWMFSMLTCWRQIQNNDNSECYINIIILKTAHAVNSIRKIGCPPIYIWNLHCGFSKRTSSLGHKWMSSPISSHGSKGDKNAHSNQVEINLDFVSSYPPLLPPSSPLQSLLPNKKAGKLPKVLWPKWPRPTQANCLISQCYTHLLSHFLAPNTCF